MYKVFGFSFSSGIGLVLFLIALAVFVPVYYGLIERSIEGDPQTSLRAIQAHCRFTLGQQLVAGEIDADSMAEWQQCDDVQIAAVDAAGGLLNPVIVKITLDPEHHLPQGKQEFVFRSANAGVPLLSGLSGIVTGRWAFNHFVTYSELTFRGSF